jgi:predicted metal-dependent hydrolase
MMREPVIDFLIVHELAHHVIFTHSKEHDTVMEKTLSDFAELDDEFSETCGALIKRGWL